MLGATRPTLVDMSRFDPHFTWGVAASAHQIEGGWVDGRGASIWDAFPGLRGGDGRVACDHYHRFPEDIALMGELGVDAYRFSVAWPRVIPDDGVVNQQGLDFYRRLCDAMAEHDITPYATLYHWDLPIWAQNKGGWLARSVVDDFCRYTETVVRALGDRIDHWITHNEPWVAAVLGHQTGDFAPGIVDPSGGLTAAHHILLSHGRAVPIIREHSANAAVGIAVDCRPCRPATQSDADIRAYRHFDGWRNRWFFDVLAGDGYPADMVNDYSQQGRWDGSLVHEGDLDAISEPIDFLGINYYTSIAIRAGNEESEDTGVEPSSDPPENHTEMGWEITPSALTDYLIHIHETYQPRSVMITENGASYSDVPDDQRRIAYLDLHIDAVGAAIESGVPVTGYFVWSFMDNLEWTLGYAQRFGLVAIDWDTLERIPKASYHWYRDFINKVR